ncbi:hypothetical protein FRZ67_00570 [Panacibacter ginsenosidivorans]|uniref:Uncharacterized protein n=1 Tax=Panacibacter ginsenosidivorans TaxID=1813871 RepID=A0A5B8V5J0_9BACT|nr:hypothetical protein [Panacibacter ginsenosidivorans]QEC65866.1 hypothetical protein FRZ67_00570 [Panacibacter ginsenosidivorans]
MPDALPIFEKFFNKEDAFNYYSIFTDNNLHPELEHPSEFFDAIIGHARSNEYYLLRLASEEFPAAKTILEKEVRLRGIPADHYLREFENNELKNILLDESDWSREDIAVAKILLDERSVSINDFEIQNAKTAQKKNIQAQQKISLPLLTLLYIVAPLGSLIPVVAGLIIYNMKDYDRDGEKNYVYSEDQRQHGLALCAIGVFSTLAWYYFLKS